MRLTFFSASAGVTGVPAAAGTSLCFLFFSLVALFGVDAAAAKVVGVGAAAVAFEALTLGVGAGAGAGYTISLLCSVGLPS